MGLLLATLAVAAVLAESTAPGLGAATRALWALAEVTAVILLELILALALRARPAPSSTFAGRNTGAGHPHTPAPAGLRLPPRRQRRNLPRPTPLFTQGAVNRVAWDPSGSNIATSVVDADSCKAITITEKAALGAERSPDGTLIAYSAFDDGIPYVHVARPDGSEDTRPVTAISNYPAWSPDGTRLAFITWSGRRTSYVALQLVTSHSFPICVGDGWSPVITHHAVTPGEARPVLRLSQRESAPSFPQSRPPRSG